MRLFLSIIAIIILVIIALLIAWNYRTPVVSYILSKQFTTPVSIEAFDLSTKQLTIKKIVIQNPPGYNSKEPAFSCDVITIDYSLSAIRQKPIYIEKLSFNKPFIYLETKSIKKKKFTNWDLITDPKETSPENALEETAEDIKKESQGDSSSTSTHLIIGTIAVSDLLLKINAGLTHLELPAKNVVIQNFNTDKSLSMSSLMSLIFQIVITKFTSFPEIQKLFLNFTSIPIDILKGTFHLLFDKIIKSNPEKDAQDPSSNQPSPPTSKKLIEDRLHQLQEEFHFQSSLENRLNKKAYLC